MTLEAESEANSEVAGAMTIEANSEANSEVAGGVMIETESEANSEVAIETTIETESQRECRGGRERLSDGDAGVAPVDPSAVPPLTPRPASAARVVASPERRVLPPRSLR